MKTFDTNIDSISFSSDLKNMNLAESLVDKVYTNYKISEDFYGNILIAVIEAVTNAIQHGNKADESKSVILTANYNDDELIFTVEDEGSGFNYENLPNPTLPENIEKEAGRGIFLIKSLADEVLFENNGAKIIIKFNIKK